MGMTSVSPRKIFNDWEGAGLPAGESHIGQFGKALVVASVSVLANTAATYIDGSLAGSGGILSFAGAARVAGGKGCVRSAMFVDRGDQYVPVALILFNTTTVSSTLTDATAMVIDDVDIANIVGVITCATTDYIDLANNRVAWKANENIYFDLPSTATTLYGVTRTSGSWTPGAMSDLGIQLQIEQF